jgi:hypothetical protein
MKISRELGISAQFYGKIEKGEVGCPEQHLITLISLLRLERSKLKEIFAAAARDKVDVLFSASKRVPRG